VPPSLEPSGRPLLLIRHWGLQANSEWVPAPSRLPSGKAFSDNGCGAGGEPNGEDRLASLDLMAWVIRTEPLPCFGPVQCQSVRHRGVLHSKPVRLVDGHLCLTASADGTDSRPPIRHRVDRATPGTTDIAATAPNLSCFTNQFFASPTSLRRYRRPIPDHLSQPPSRTSVITNLRHHQPPPSPTSLLSKLLPAFTRSAFEDRSSFGA